MSGILPSIILPADIEAVQARLKASADGTNESVKACAALDAPTKASWSFFYAAVSAYCAVPIHWYANTTGSLYERGLDYEAELLQYQELIQGKGCQLTVPLHDVTPPPPPAVDFAKWIAIGVTAAAGAYGLSKLVEIIPALRKGKSAPKLTEKKA